MSRIFRATHRTRGEVVSEYALHSTNVGQQVIWRFSLRKEGGRTYYSPLFFHTADEARDKALRVLQSER